MQVEKGYAELYAWVVFTVLHYKGSFLKLVDMVGAINENVPGCEISLDKGFRFGDVVIPVEMMHSIKSRNQQELERFFIAQPENTLFPSSKILDEKLIRDALTKVEERAHSATMVRREVYAMLSLHLRRCLATPEQMIF